MRTVKITEQGFEYDILIESHDDIAKEIEGLYDGYRLVCYKGEHAIKIYEKSLNYFEKKFRNKIGILYFDINTDTVYYKQYGFKCVGECIGIYKAVINQLRKNDVLILKGKTSSRTEYRKRIGAIKKELNNFTSDNKYVYIPENFLKKWK